MRLIGTKESFFDDYQNKSYKGWSITSNPQNGDYYAVKDGIRVDYQYSRSGNDRAIIWAIDTYKNSEKILNYSVRLANGVDSFLELLPFLDKVFEDYRNELIERTEADLRNLRRDSIGKIINNSRRIFEVELELRRFNG